MASISCVTRGRKGLGKSAIFKCVHHRHWFDCLVFSWIVVAAVKSGMRGFIACPSEGINHEYNRKGERLLKPQASLQEVTFDSIPGCSPKRSHI